MNQNTIVCVGTFAMRKDMEKGIHVFRYDKESGDMEYLDSYLKEKNIGFQCYDETTDTLYAAHEWKDSDGQGKLLVLKTDHESGKITILQEIPTLSPQPSHIFLDRTGRKVILPHHGSDEKVSKVMQDSEGKWYTEVAADDVAIDVFSLNDDGSIDSLTDVLVFKKEDYGKAPHLHYAALSPSGNMLLVTDKGNDLIHVLTYEPDTGKILKRKTLHVPEGYNPRYLVFHPEIPVFYANNEKYAYVDIWQYDEKGNCRKVDTIPVTEDENVASGWNQEGAADFLISPDGKFVYLSVRGLNLISTFAVNPDNGTLILIQNVSCGGKNPRSIEFSPEGKFIFAANRDTDNICRFLINEDGTLTFHGEIHCYKPGNISFI